MPEDKGYYIRGIEENSLSGIVLEGNDFLSSAMLLSQQVYQKRIITPYAERPYSTDTELVHLVYGEPIVRAFDDFQVVISIEEAFTLMRTSDPESDGPVYITRHNISKRFYSFTWESALDATKVPITRGLRRVFDVDAVRYAKKLERYGHQVNLAFREGMRRAGLSWKDAPRHPGKKASPEEVTAHQRDFQRFYLNVVKHATQPRTPLVKVVGIDSILEGIPVRDHKHLDIK